MYRESSPHPLLTPYIRCYWSLEKPNLDLGGQKSSAPPRPPLRVFPDACIELIINYGAPPMKNGAPFPQPRTFIAGQITQYILLSPGGPTGVFSVRFHPHGLHRFTRIPIVEFTNREVALRHLWRHGDDLEGRVIEGGTFSERKAAADAFFLNLASNSDRCNATLFEAASRHLKPDPIRVHHLAAELRISTRQLERRFLGEVGLTPKRYGRIIRLQSMLRQLESGQVANLTDLAYELGYADQAHMNRDFKQLAGLNPSQYLRQKHDLYFDDAG